MLDGTSIGLKVDVDTLRGTREGVPRLAALFKKHGVQATFYFSVGPDHTGRALRRVFRKGFARKVARTSVLKHYGLKTLMYGVLLPGPDIGRAARDSMRRVHDAGFEVGLHTYDHVRWQDHVAGADAPWTRAELERGVEAFGRVFGFPPQSHAAAGWQINQHALELERELGFKYASDTRGAQAFFPLLAAGPSPCPQIPTTLPTFDELLGREGTQESNIPDAVLRLSASPNRALQVFTLHAELEGGKLHDPFESLLVKWRDAGATLVCMADIHARLLKGSLATRAVVMGEIPGRSGTLAVAASDVEPSGAAASGKAAAGEAR
jgi:undecaprenyl phosphate-alpha-L-ara4FN deformylase